MNEVGKLIKEALEHQGKTQAWLAEFCGVSNNAVSKWINGSGQISRENIRKVANALGLRASELLNTDTDDSITVGFAQEFHFPENSYPVNPEKKSFPPVFGKGMGGLPDRIFTDEGRVSNGHDEYAEVLSGDDNAFVIRVEGNSMFPKYAHGEYALVEPNTVPEIEDDVLIKLSTGEVMLKRLISRRGGIHLSSYNESGTYDFQDSEIVWMYYVAHPVPSRKIKTRF